MWGNKAEEHYNKAKSLYNQGSYSEALAAYENCLRCNPDRQQQQLALSGKLFTLNKLKRYQEGLRVAETIANDPMNAETKTYALCMRAKFLYNLDEIKEARIQLYEVLRRDPRSRLGIQVMVDVLLRLEEYQEALRLLEKAVIADPNVVEFYVQRGKVLRRLKRYQEALVAFETALHFDPTNESCLEWKYVTLIDLES